MYSATIVLLVLLGCDRIWPVALQIAGGHVDCGGRIFSIGTATGRVRVASVTAVAVLVLFGFRARTLLTRLVIAGCCIRQRVGRVKHRLQYASSRVDEPIVHLQ